MFGKQSPKWKKDEVLPIIYKHSSFWVFISFASGDYFKRNLGRIVLFKFSSSLVQPSINTRRMRGRKLNEMKWQIFRSFYFLAFSSSIRLNICGSMTRHEIQELGDILSYYFYSGITVTELFLFDAVVGNLVNLRMYIKLSNVNSFMFNVV